MERLTTLQILALSFLTGFITDGFYNLYQHYAFRDDYGLVSIVSFFWALTMETAFFIPPKIRKIAVFLGALGYGLGAAFWLKLFPYHL